MGASVDKLKSGINDLLKGNYVLPTKLKDNQDSQVQGSGSQVQGSGSQVLEQEQELDSTQEPSLKRSSSTGLKLRSTSLKNSQSGETLQNF
jgi:hypothetical protein